MKILEQEGSTFAPEINNTSKEIANNLMLKYYGKGFKKQQTPKKQKKVVQI